MRIDLYVHNNSHSTSLESKVDEILHILEGLVAKVDELNAELVEINNVTNEIAADIDDLVAKVGEGSMSAAEADAVKSQLTDLKTRLTGIASTHTS